MAENGLKTAVDLVLEAQGAGAPAPEPEQIDLEDLLGLPKAPVSPGSAPGGEPRRGRPPGSRNRRTVQWCEFILRRYASPLEVLAQMTVAPIDELRAALGCTALEAFQEKRHAATALAPFLHQRQPLALNITERKVVYLTITTEKPDGRSAGDAVTLDAEVIPIGAPSEPEPDATDSATVTAEGATP